MPWVLLRLTLALHVCKAVLYPSLEEFRECSNVTSGVTNAVKFTASRHLYVSTDTGTTVTKWLLGTDLIFTGETIVAGSVDRPRGIEVDEATGAVAVIDTHGDITVWTSPTSFATIRNGSVATSQQPRHLLLRDGYLYFSGRNQIMRMPLDGSAPEEAVAGRDTSSGTADDQFDRPQGFALDEAGNNLYVVDRKNVRVMKWPVGASSGTLVAGRLGEKADANELDLFKGPSSIRVDAGGNLYVVDRDLKRIVKWAPGAQAGELFWNFTDNIWDIEFDGMGGFFAATKSGVIWCSTTTTTTTTTMSSSTTGTFSSSSTSSGTSTSSATRTSTATATGTVTGTVTSTVTTTVTTTVTGTMTGTVTSTVALLTSSSTSTLTSTRSLTSSVSSTMSSAALVPSTTTVAEATTSVKVSSSDDWAAASSSPAAMTAASSTSSVSMGWAEASTPMSVLLMSSTLGTAATAAATSTASSTASATASRSTTTHTASSTPATFPAVQQLLQWLDTAEQGLLATLQAQPSRNELEENVGVGVMQAFRMRSSGGDYSFPVADAMVTLPASLLTSLNLSSLLGVATACEPSLMAALPGRDELGAVVEAAAGINVNLYSEDGSPLAVSGLPEPVALSLPVQDRRAVCAYWHEGKEVWSYEGLEGGHGRGLRCLSRHLTLFGAIIKGFVMALSCAQLELLSLEALKELASGGWFATPIAVMYWLMLLALAAMLLAARIRDRATAHLWNDEFFLIPRHPQKPETFTMTESQKAEAFSVWGCVTAPCHFCVSSAWRDLLDEVVSRWFSYFGDVRGFCESVCHGLELRSSGSGEGARAIVQKLMASLVSNIARRQACSSLGLSMDLVTFVTDDAQLGKLLFEAALESTKPESSVSSKAEWLRLHRQVVHELYTHWDAPCTWRRLPQAMGRLLLVSNPATAAFSQCPFQTRSARVMLIACELLGAFMLSCIFFEASGGVASKKNKAKQCEAQGAWEQMGQLLAFALASLLFAAVPVLLISSLQSRSLRKLDYEGCEEWQRQLAAWRMQDKLFWAVAGLYLAFCSFFVALFLANVGLEDHNTFGIAVIIQVCEDMLVVPVGMSAFLASFAFAVIKLAAWQLRKSSREALRQCREERQRQEGNWHHVVLDI